MSTHVERLWRFVSDYEFFGNVQISEFAVEELWEHPAFDGFREMENIFTIDDLFALGALEPVKRCMWPRDLCTFIDRVGDLQMQRQCCSSAVDDENLWGMKPKKSYEIQQLGRFIAKTCTENGIHNVVDIGAGQGYLSFHLAMHSGLHVLAVEKKEMQSFDERVRRTKGKDKHWRQEGGSLQILREYVTSDTLTSKEIAHGSLICSLHSCGDLSATMVEIFLGDARITAMVNIGCCYNLMTDTFPMSNALRREGAFLSRSQKKIALQAPDTWSLEVDGSRNFFRHHFYRALFSLFLLQRGLLKRGDAQPIVGKLTVECFESFSAYCSAALRKLQLDHIASADADECARLETANSRLQIRIGIAWLLKSLVGSVIEALVLEDRCERIREGGFECELIPVFDMKHSPRNMAIVSIKK